MSEPDSNPYASPADVIVETPNEMIIATQGQRFATFLIDQIVVRVIAFSAGMVIGAIMFSSGMEFTEDDQLTLTLIDIGIGTSLFVAYFVVMEFAFQRTIGKLAAGTKVVNLAGGKPTVGQIIGRSFARFIPFEAFSFLGGKNPVGWHDSLSRTRVVKLKPSSRDKYLQQHG